MPNARWEGVIHQNENEKEERRAEKTLPTCSQGPNAAQACPQYRRRNVQSVDFQCGYPIRPPCACEAEKAYIVYAFGAESFGRSPSSVCALDAIVFCSCGPRREGLRQGQSSPSPDPSPFDIEDKTKRNINPPRGIGVSTLSRCGTKDSNSSRLAPLPCPPLPVHGFLASPSAWKQCVVSRPKHSSQSIPLRTLEAGRM